MDESHRLWTEALADAAHTTPDCVALHCVHQHNAPFIDREGNALLRKAGADPLLYDEKFVAELVKRSAAAVRDSLNLVQPVTHIRVGEAEVKEVASNRRVLGPDGKIKYVRTSATNDPAARAEPAGTIDPILRSVGFFQDNRPLARLYYYTTHPMSYYGDGRASSDFVGLARQRRDEEEPGVARRLLHWLGRQRYGRQVQRWCARSTARSSPTGFTRGWSPPTATPRSGSARSSGSTGSHPLTFSTPVRISTSML